MAKSADYKLGEFSFARGWFVVAESVAITEKPHSAHYFGEDVIIYRGESGAVVMLGAYCRHMGTHLGNSTASYTVRTGHIENDSIRCPFHGWRYRPDGRCDDIPYFDGVIPPIARVRSWPVRERYGIVFCWNDPEGLEPDFDLPDCPEWDDPGYLRWAGLDHLADLPCHPIEVFDNNSDHAHLHYLHGGPASAYENAVEGHFYRQRVRLGAAGSDDTVRVATTNNYVGPGINFARFVEPDNPENTTAVQIIATTPIDDGSARLWQCSMIKRPLGASDEQAAEQMAYFNQAVCHGLGTEDGEIWANKKPAIAVLQMPTDGPFRAGRIWYSQFFNPRHMADAIIEAVTGLHHVPGIPGVSEPEPA